MWASVVAVPGLESTGSVVVVCRGPAPADPGIRSGDGVSEDQDTIASIRY